MGWYIVHNTHFPYNRDIFSEKFFFNYSIDSESNKIVQNNFLYPLLMNVNLPTRLKYIVSFVRHLFATNHKYVIWN